MEIQSSTSENKFKKFLSSDLFFISCHLVIIILIFSPFLFSNQMLYSSDQMGGLDSKFFLKNSLEHFHQLPMWFSSRLGGMPSIDAMFGDPFYFPSIFFNSLLPIHKSIGIKMIFHLFLSGVFFFLLLRKGFKIHPLIAFTGGVFYMLNPQFLSHIYPGHDGKMYVIAWVPFVVWRLKALLETASLKNAALFSLGISMILLTSHIQMSYFVLWGLGLIWIAGSVFMIKHKQTGKFLHVTLLFWLSVGIALLIALAQLLPSYMYINHAFSVRGVDRGPEFAASWSLHWGEVFSLWIPELVNSLEYYWGQNPFKLNSEYAGGMALLLAILSIIYKPTKWRIFWGGFATLAIGFSLGAHSFIWSIAYHVIPGVAKFRAASMFMFWFSFSVVLLSALFLKDILKNRFSTLNEVSKKKWTSGILISMGVLLVITIAFSNISFVKNLFEGEIGQKENVFSANFSKNYLPSLWLWFVGCSSILALLLAVVHNKIKPVTFVIAALILGTADLLKADMQFIKLVDPRPYLYTEPALKDLQQKMKTEPFRCFTLPGTLPQNSEGIHGLEGVSGFHDNELRWYREFRGEQDRNYLLSLVKFDNQGQPYLDASQLNLGNPFLDLANVRYLLVRSQNTLLAIENKNALGRVSFVRNYTVLDSNKIIDALQNGTYDYRTTVALMSKPQNITEPSGNNNSDGNFSCEWKLYSPNHRKVEVNIPSDGFLRISETFYPGWAMKVDGKATTILRADNTWMAIPIQKGKHQVEMNIESLYLGKVVWISIIAASLLLFYLIAIWILPLKSVIPTPKK